VTDQDIFLKGRLAIHAQIGS